MGCPLSEHPPLATLNPLYWIVTGSISPDHFSKSTMWHRRTVLIAGLILHQTHAVMLAELGNRGYSDGEMNADVG